MPVELSAENGPVFLEFEIYGPLTTDDLEQIVTRLEGDSEVQKISIEIATENPATLELPKLIQKDPLQKRKRTADDTLDKSDETESQESTPPEESEPGTITDTEENQIPQLRTDSAPFGIMRIVASHDEWLRTQEMVDEIPNEWDVSENTLGSNLWSLADRGLVEKRPYEPDNRQKEYRITELGEQALSEAIERAENLQPLH